jgi:hypothetical protein
MANVINAQNGIVSTADSTSELNIQTGGVNAISIGTGQTVTISNAALTNFSATSATITTLSSTSANITTLTGTSATITNILDGSGNLRNIPSAGSEKTSTYTLTVSDVGEYVTLGTGGGIDVPSGIFSSGNAVSIFNNTTGNRTISLTITTAYIAGTDSDKASVTLATRGLATILFISNSVCILTGNVS